MNHRSEQQGVTGRALFERVRPRTQPRKLRRICVDIPDGAVTEQQHDELCTAIADAAYDWEPTHRDGWDIDVHGSAVDDERRCACGIFLAPCTGCDDMRCYACDPEGTSDCDGRCNRCDTEREHCQCWHDDDVWHRA